MLAGFRLERQAAEEVVRALPVLHDQVEAVGAGFAGRRALKVAEGLFDGLAWLGRLRRPDKVQIVDYVVIRCGGSTCGR